MRRISRASALTLVIALSACSGKEAPAANATGAGTVSPSTGTMGTGTGTTGAATTGTGTTGSSASGTGTTSPTGAAGTMGDTTARTKPDTVHAR